MVQGNVMEYVCCEPDGSWHYSATPLTQNPQFDKSITKPLSKNSAIRRVKMWGFPLSDPEDEDAVVP